VGLEAAEGAPPLAAAVKAAAVEPVVDVCGAYDVCVCVCVCVERRKW